VILLVDPIKLCCTRVKFILGASLDIVSYDVSKDANTLEGMSAKLVEMEPLVVPQGLNGKGPYLEILVPEYFPPGSITLFGTHLHEYDASLDALCTSGAKEALTDLDLVDLNVLLHHADGEERDASNGEFGCTTFPVWERWCTAGWKGGCIRCGISCAIRIWGTRFADTCAKGAGHWTTCINASSSRFFFAVEGLFTDDGSFRQSEVLP
jgi:hypothetical protein